MPSFKERFDAMVQTLRAHPRVEVFAVEIRPPADGDTLEIAEAVLEQPLPPALRAFYAAHDGVFLEWGLKGVDYPYHAKPFRFAADDELPGRINIVPVEAAISKEWERNFLVNEISPQQQANMFGAVVRPSPPFHAVCIDLFSSWSQGDLIIGPEPMMVVSDDHGAGMDASNFMPFEVYLDVVLASFGARATTDAFSTGGGTPRRVDRWDARPTLDEILKRL